MLRLATDADFNGRLLRALRRRLPELDLVRVQDVGLRTAPDPEILAWTAAEGRILLSHDYKTMIKHAADRIQAGLPLPGLFLLPNSSPQIGALAENLDIVIQCSTQEEWENQIVHLPV